MKFKTKVIISLIIFAIILIILIFSLFSKKNGEHDFYIVEKGEVYQDITETGTIKKGDKILLSFKNSGQLKEVYVEIGDEVKEGALLAKVDNTQLYIQLQQSKAGLELNQSELDKLLAGATEQEIQIAQTSIDNANTTLENEEKDLENALATADQALEDVYEDALNTLNDSYLKLYNASTAVKLIQATYFTGNDQDSSDVKDGKDEIIESLEEMEFYLDKAEINFTEQNMGFALVNFEKNLADSRNSLSKIREIIESNVYTNVVSSTDKTSLDTHRTNINTVYANVIGEQQDISSAKISNKTNIDTAESAVAVAKDALKVAENNLALVIAEPREEDISLYQAKVKSAQASVNMLESQIRDTILKSPIDGIIVAVENSVSETVQAASPIISILPAEPFEIELDIYEEDIVSIRRGNLAKISLVAFPDEIFEGMVVFIDPAEKLIDGIVYYEVSINFEAAPEGVKSGMTADVSVITTFKDGVLIIPDDAIETKDEEVFVRIFEDNKIEERSIEIGIEGSNDMVEIIVGLDQGEKIIIDN
ncbi:MAG: efflux RND transporter periplasmic adaptor subunit [Patescibacteria group bacterium]|nr:efflux RND transporter periplasmic adaptor subunit [Patescibacteria group bacterium]